MAVTQFQHQMVCQFNPINTQPIFHNINNNRLHQFEIQ